MSSFITTTSVITNIAITVPNISGGTDGRVVRLNGTNSVVDASQGDTVSQLNTVLIKTGNVYYAGGVVGGFSNLNPGSSYFLSTLGNITATPPTPTSSIRVLFLGFALNTTDLLFRPGTPITGT